jgi:hypothetical protein
MTDRKQQTTRREYTIMAEKTELERTTVLPQTKRDIGILKGIERRPEYEIVADAVKLYKAMYHGHVGGKLRKQVESLPETELVLVNHQASS